MSAATVFALETVMSPVRVMASLPKPFIPDEPYAVVTAEAVPVIVVTAVAVTATVVAPSIVFRFAAVTEESPTVIV